MLFQLKVRQIPHCIGTKYPTNLSAHHLNSHQRHSVLLSNRCPTFPIFPGLVLFFFLQRRQIPSNLHLFIEEEKQNTSNSSIHHHNSLN
jgi:hypothetical protein